MPHYGFVKSALQTIDSLTADIRNFDSLKRLLDPTNKEDGGVVRTYFSVSHALGGRDVRIDDAAFWADVASLIDKHQARLRKEQEEVLAQAARRIVSESASC